MEPSIRTAVRTLGELTEDKLSGIGTQTQRLNRRLTKRSKKRLIRSSILAANLLVLAAAVGFVLHSPQNTPVVSNSISSTANPDASGSALDQVSSADIAVYVSQMAGLDETTSVANKADTVNAQLAVTPADDTVVAKPQIVATALKSRLDIQNYVVKTGDTVPSVAAKFGVTSDTIRWSNGIDGDALQVGHGIVISPVSGIIYAVKSGDTPDTLAAKYKANATDIITFNDAEVGGLKVGEQIVIPNGNATPAPVVRAAAALGGGFAFGGGAVYTGSASNNGYDQGYCTWWAAYRRAQIGKPVPSNLGNASTWKVLAQQAGLAVGNTPQAGAVIWFPPTDWYGHVGYVESVNSDGSANISEMNVDGWNHVDYRTIPAAQATQYSYIY